MKFIRQLCIVCLIICAVFISSSDAAFSGWTTPASGSGSYTVDETDAANSEVATLECSVDSVGGSAVYAIDPANSKFAVGASTGALTITSALDYDIDHATVLTVTCTDDGGGAVGTATITINVNDQPTFATTQFAGTIPDGSTEGTALVTVSVIDQNNDDTQTYSITAGNTNTDWAFDGNILKVAAGKTLNATALAGYSLTIKSNDGSQDSSNMPTVWIAVTTCSSATATVVGGMAIIVTVALSKLL